MFVCTVCEETFLTVDLLGSHLIFFHQLLKSGNFFCYYCKKSFMAIDKFKLHLIKKHPEGGLPTRVENHEGVAVEDDNFNHEIDPHIEEQNINNDENPIQNDNILSLENFVTDLYTNVELFIAQLYAMPTSNRKLVEDVVSGTSQLISTSVAQLKHNVFNFVSKFDDLPENYGDEVSKIRSMFDCLENLFDLMGTEHKRFQSLSDSGSFIPPVKFEMGEVEKYQKTPEGPLVLVKQPVYGQMVPLRHVLKKFLEMPGVLKSIQKFINELDDSKVRHFIQGTLWKDVKKKFEEEGKFVLPLHLKYDDYEPDNSLGSHSSSHSLGALYAAIACLPPEAQSCLDNLFLFTLFESKYKKMFGNVKAFSCAIDEVEFLEKNGVTVDCGEGPMQIYFCTPLIIADNLGYNVILGFVEGFSGNYYCRICKLHKNEMNHRCRPVPQNKLRTVENYNEDLAVGDVSLTGVEEPCVWNNMPSYHCITNFNCDSMHDVHHGVIKYDLCQILYYLIHDRNYFSTDLLIERIEGFDFGPNDVGNRPPTKNMSDIDKFKTSTLNLSASEWVCLCLYLGEMVGDLVPEENEVWKLYLILREIVLIICAPSFSDGIDIYLQTLVMEHHELYLKYFGNLKPKHHLLLHHAATMKKNGPLLPVSSFSCERSHRRGKLYAKVCNSRVNFAFSSAIKFQLILCERLLRPDGIDMRLVKSFNVRVKQVQTLTMYGRFAHLLNFNCFDVVSVAECVQIYGTRYCVNSILVLSDDNLPVFGKICHIIVKDSRHVIFILNILETVSYLPHICSYEVKPTGDFTVLEHSKLMYYVPLWGRQFFEKCVVSLKHLL